MPNQYTKVQLQLEIEKPKDIEPLQKELTKAYFSLIKNCLPKNKAIIDELINKIHKEFRD